MSGTGPAPRRRRIAGERSGTAGAPEAPAAPRTPAPRRPTRPVRPSRDTGAGTPPPSSSTRPSRERKPRAPREPRQRRPLGTLLRPPAAERRWFVPLALVAAVCLLAGLVLAGRGGWQVWQDRSLTDAQSAAASAAGTAVETMYTYDSRTLDKDSAQAEKLLTPRFRTQYAKIVDTLGELGDQRQITIRSTARDTAALPCGDECSSSVQRVMVFFDLSRSTGEGTVPDVFGNRVALTMVQRDGTWLVNNVEVL
ncbi:hypothetical protein [Solicola sp. PLA-1-18]|uniref:hypothetical protein n=1 Tax=Solicola sp. PLA-1-18 TaxID=3380532 RepID=UPI003B7C4D64